MQHSGAREVRQFKNFKVRAVSVPVRAVSPLAARGDIAYVSLDREVRTLGHVSQTTGADAVRNQTSQGVSYTLDGGSIGLAVLDSGIDPLHVAFNNATSKTRVAASVDFTGENRTDDPYGHGTHVASLAAGNGKVAEGAYVGVAPNVNIVNLRVLNSRGIGSVSGLLGALDWLLSNRTTYNVRVINMSLGMPAVDSYVFDPVCQAVRHLVDAGVVAVAAAGNNGNDADGRKVYGQIHAPGNEPSAITVGASNTFGTDARADDVITTYSSRGPTRSFWADELGTKHYDNLIKPDLVAPGNKIVAAQAAQNYLIAQNPSLVAGVSSNAARAQMCLNGTSMAAPSAAGAAALLLQANPRLTPNLVKAVLMYTAQPLPGHNMFEQGAGQLNIEGAVRLAKLIRPDLSPGTRVGAPLLTAATPPAPETSIAGHAFVWAQGVIMDQTYARGAELITAYQTIYGTGLLLADGTALCNGALVADPSMMSSGVIIGDSVVTSSGGVLGEGAAFLSVSQLLGDGVIIGDGVITGDAALQSAGVLQAYSSMVNGDDTASMR